MKLLLAAIVVLSTGCGYVDGACWARSDDRQGSGAGGGPIVPGGVGGYGDSYAEPQDVDPDRDMPDECWIEACHDKCDRLREEDLRGCQKIPAEKQDGCRQRAKERVAECRRACDDDPIERCKQGCDKIYNACMDRCKDGPCRDQCFKDYVNCLRDCER